MKKLLILGLAIILSETLVAQLAIRPTFGINSVTLTEDIDDGEWRSRLGYQLGIDVQLGDRFYIQPGLFWESHNNLVTPDDTGLRINFKSTHIRMPLTVGVKLFDGALDRIFNVRLYGGLDASFRLSTDGNDKLFNLNMEDGSIKKAFWGYHAGAGADFLFLFADIGYRWGASRFFKMESVNNGARMNVFYANVGLKISF